MADDGSSSGSALLSCENSPSPSKEVAVVEEKKVPRYFNPHSIAPIQRGKNYASSVVTSQQTVLENLRWTRHELDKEDRALQRLQEEIRNSNALREYGRAARTQMYEKRRGRGVKDDF